MDYHLAIGIIAKRNGLCMMQLHEHIWYFGNKVITFDRNTENIVEVIMYSR